MRNKRRRIINLVLVKISMALRVAGNDLAAARPLSADAAVADHRAVDIQSILEIIRIMIAAKSSLLRHDYRMQLHVIGRLRPDQNILLGNDRQAIGSAITRISDAAGKNNAEYQRWHPPDSPTRPPPSPWRSR